MRILLLTQSFNSLAQRLYAELVARGHELSVEFDIGDEVTVEAVAMFRPDLVVAPFMKRAIPAAVWSRHTCLVVHPGIPGDRGPSALDWAIERGEREWGVTVLQANAEMDAGDVWSSEAFAMREATKSSLYRFEVTEAAARAVLRAVEGLVSRTMAPAPQRDGDPSLRGSTHPPMRQADRAIDWTRDRTARVLAKLRAADGAPGVLETLLGCPVFLHGGHREGRLTGAPGEIVATREGAICRATVDGAVWITHLRECRDDGLSLKLPAAAVLGTRLAGVPSVPAPLERDAQTWQDLAYEERDGVGWLHFDFHNGAMSTRQCGRLLDAYRHAASRSGTRVLVLAGGRDFWSNGIHLHAIEDAASPADESWRCIQAIDDLAREILTDTRHLTVAALRGNAGAGGVFLALAADEVWARDGVVLNAHYRNMGNLYGSEYWTYVLPRRAGAKAADAIARSRLPLLARDASNLGLVDRVLAGDADRFDAETATLAGGLARDPDLERRLADKRARRAADEAAKPLDAYRTEELERMRRNFYGFDPSYHVARHHFVYRVPHAWTPLYLARHRREFRRAPVDPLAA